MLIRGAAIDAGRSDRDGLDVRIAGGRIAAIGRLQAAEGEAVVEAAGRLLLPGLHDHHIHLAALAASLTSVSCGPPTVHDRDGLAAALSRAGTGWLRGTGYHESVAGMPDRAMLDAMVPDRPVRIQHRGGRMWFLNSAALDLLLAAAPAPPGLDRASGRLFDDDGWARAALASQPPALAEVGALLARAGITGVTDMTPSNDPATARHIAGERDADRLPQRVVLAGAATLADRALPPGIALGPLKLHLHEAALPDFDGMVAAIRRAHDAGRPVAVHCVTEVELVFTLAALEAAGTIAGDRIEHASIAPDSAVAEIARLGLSVVSQPHFIHERGDAYRRDVAAADRPLLYRLRSFAALGVPLAGGSDAPFGAANPWASMAAACRRRTAAGATIGTDEALDADAAMHLYLADPHALATRRRIAVGTAADLCLIDRDRDAARADPGSVRVDITWIDGRPVHQRVDQAPA